MDGSGGSWGLATAAGSTVALDELTTTMLECERTEGSNNKEAVVVSAAGVSPTATSAIAATTPWLGTETHG